MQVIVKEILSVTLGNINDHVQHFTFCCRGHSDLNSYFKNLSTSNTFLTLGKRHKSKHTLSTLSFKYDSMCHGQVVYDNPEFT